MHPTDAAKPRSGHPFQYVTPSVVFIAPLPSVSSSLVFLCGLFIVVQLLNHVRLFATPWTAACQASLSFTISLNLLKHMSIESVMPSNHAILGRPLVIPFSSCLQSFPASGSLPVSWPFASGGQSIRASALASVPPMKMQGRFPL